MAFADLPLKRWILLATNLGFPIGQAIFGASSLGLAVEMVAHGLMFYAFVAPGCGWLVPVITRFRPEGKQLWLTIDDGPIDEKTSRLALELSRRGARATFFVIGQRLANYPEIAQSVAGAGHTLANHTMTHPLASFFYLFPQALAQEIDSCAALLPKTDSAEGMWFRSPFGIKNLFLERMLVARKLRMIAWSLRAHDGLICRTASVIQRIVNAVRTGDIILMHERGSENLDAILGVVDELQRRGFSFVIPTDAQLIQG